MKRPFETHRHRREDNTKIHLKQIYEDANRIHLSQDMDQLPALVKMLMIFLVTYETIIFQPGKWLIVFEEGIYFMELVQIVVSR
jgi:hypothetical protein